MLPVIRADLAVCETYIHLSGPRLACPIAALGGAADRKVRLQDLAAWRSHTTGPFSMHLFSGGHFFLHDDTGAAIAHLAEHLSTLAHLSVA